MNGSTNSRLRLLCPAEPVVLDFSHACFDGLSRASTESCSPKLKGLKWCVPSVHENCELWETTVLRLATWLFNLCCASKRLWEAATYFWPQPCWAALFGLFVFVISFGYLYCLAISRNCQYQTSVWIPAPRWHVVFKGWFHERWVSKQPLQVEFFFTQKNSAVQARQQPIWSLWRTDLRGNFRVRNLMAVCSFWVPNVSNVVSFPW